MKISNNPRTLTLAIERAWEDMSNFQNLIRAMSSAQRAEQFKRIRLARGFTPEDYARKWKRPVQTIRDWEAGRRKTEPDVEKFSALFLMKRKQKLNDRGGNGGEK